MDIHWREIDGGEPNGYSPYVTTERADVPGGYLVRLITYSFNGSIMSASGPAFVPDAVHSDDGDIPA